MKKLIFISTFALFLNACAGDSDSEKSTSNGENVQKEEVVAKSVSEEKFKIMFFLNPNGRPCQMQNKILNDMGNDLSSKAGVEYISTTEMATSRPLFAKYGIRALPSLIVLDSKGNVHHRFTPGIQSADVILSKIGG